MNMTMEAILLYALPYEIKHDNGEIGSGLSLWVHPTSDLSPEVGERGDIGYKPLKLGLPLSLRHKLISAPGVYKFQVAMQAGPNNTARMVAKDIDYIGEAKVTIEKPKPLAQAGN